MEEQFRELLSKRKRRLVNGERLRHSAVLLPLFTKNGSVHILFIRRSQQVAQHKGEISFPGGLREEGDNCLERTALRETLEEIGVQPRDVVVLGMVDDMETVSTRYRVTPVVGIIPYPYPFTLSVREVDAILTVPVSHLLDEGNGKEESILLQGKRYTGPVYRYRDCLIWGATARIVKNFLALWKKSQAPG